MRTEYLRCTFLTVHTDGDTSFMFSKRDTLRIQPNPYSFSLQDFTHGVRNIFVFPPNQAWSHLYNRDFAPEAAIHLSEFQPDIRAANDDEILRQKIDLHHRGDGKKWNSTDPRHLRNRGAST